MQHIKKFNASVSLTAVWQLFVYQTIQISKMAANVYNRVLYSNPMTSNVPLT